MSKTSPKQYYIPPVDDRTFIERILDWDIRLLIVLPLLLGLGFLILFLYLITFLPEGLVRDALMIFSASIASLIWSLSGFIQIYRRESMGFWNLSEKAAVFNGVLTAGLFCIVALILVILGIWYLIGS